MKKVEEYINSEKHFNDWCISDFREFLSRSCVERIVEQAQKDAYNQAIDDVIKSVKVVNTKKLNFETGKWENIPLIDQTSILKLKK